jgi:hypothetical protein
MKKKYFQAFFVIFILLYGRIAPAQNDTFPGIKKTGTVKVLDDFEDPSTLKNWNGTILISNEFSSHGKNCGALTAPGGRSLVLESEKIPGKWSEFDYLKFDIYNPSSRLCYGSIRLFDELGTDEQAEFQGQSYNGEKIFVNTGWNHYEFLLHNAMVEQGDRPLALDRIRKLRFSFDAAGHSLYIDNIRLVSGLENNQTASKVNPQDCKVVIDNRYVYPGLAGPVELIKTSPEINQLRKEAATAVEKLKKEISILEMQGYQTLYQRIPLITADVGLGIRSKLVWFQNEEEEGKILKYIIKSCSEAAKESEVILSAQQTKILLNEPENDVSSLSKYQSWYVPSYPPLNKLNPRDGFYRDEKGNPVIVFSMLQLNSGPLMDYFAPFNHRIESYTVGGGSRYDIESSPVYKAFHKYPDTHRVGWDGWCGHLVKDKWSMGGKKEDVVICLESPHIRQAVLDYIKLHYREWIDNPDLLYNIMAYELQYVCYCDRSQEMFRKWLLSKYTVINTLNKNWKTQYKLFKDIKAPETHNARPANEVNRAAWYDWASFNTRRFTDYLKWIKSEMRKFDTGTPICAGGTSSMLSSANSISGIDEEMIINEADDVILNESGGSPIFSDLLLSLCETKKVMVDPEMGGGTHGILLQFLHGKSDISKWWWANAPSMEYPKMNQSSLPHSKDISLPDIDEVLRIGLDVRRLASEIAGFTSVEPEVAILYSKTSILQVPPQQVQAGRTPYIDAIYSAWEGSRFLGCRIGFISENQILAGKLKKFKLLIVPAAKFMKPDVTAAIENYIKEGGTAVIIPESFIFNQFAQENNKIAEFGITITGVTYPPVVGSGEKVQNYDQSFSQAIMYGAVERKMTTLPEDIFANELTPLSLVSNGLVQTIGPGTYNILAKFDDGKAAIVNSKSGKGSLYYLAAPLKSGDYHLLLSALAQKLGLKRPVVGIDQKGKLITGVEVRAVERAEDYLVYACNLQPDPVEFDLRGEGKLGTIQDIRSLVKLPGEHIKLEPYQETIFRVEKLK